LSTSPKLTMMTDLQELLRYAPYLYTQWKLERFFFLSRSKHKYIMFLYSKDWE